jgi:hypothetical protein
MRAAHKIRGIAILKATREELVRESFLSAGAAKEPLEYHPKLILRIGELENELAAEREKRDEMLLAIVTAKTDLVKVKQQLAAEREKREAQRAHRAGAVKQPRREERNTMSDFNE